ncbi:MAG: S-layer homology domain-containing protein [Oscillospiraceae bacterium]|nr:S-layer homology domain-containing protein [Oscillospiraceae bacterium]
MSISNLAKTSRKALSLLLALALVLSLLPPLTAFAAAPNPAHFTSFYVTKGTGDDKTNYREIVFGTPSAGQTQWTETSPNNFEASVYAAPGEFVLNGTFAVNAPQNTADYNSASSPISYGFEASNTQGIWASQTVVTFSEYRFYGVNNPDNDTITLATYTVTLVPTYNLVSITPPTAITGVAHGTAKTATALGLPTEVTIATDNGGGNRSAAVTWDVAGSAYNPATTAQQTFSVNGTVTLPDDVVANGVTLNATVSVTVNAAPVIIDLSWTDDELTAAGNASGGKFIFDEPYIYINGGPIIITGSMTPRREIYVKNASNPIDITLSDAHVEHDQGRFVLEITLSDVNLTLVGDNSFKVGANANVISVNGSNLSISGEGRLLLQSGHEALELKNFTASEMDETSTVTINGGTVTAISDYINSYGIGGKGNVIINGGSVKATGVAGAIEGQPVNAANQPVYLGKLGEQSNIESVTVGGVDWSIAANHPGDSALYLWLPRSMDGKTVTTTRATISNGNTATVGGTKNYTARYNSASGTFTFTSSQTVPEYPGDSNTEVAPAKPGFTVTFPSSPGNNSSTTAPVVIPTDGKDFPIYIGNAVYENISAFKADGKEIDSNGLAELAGQFEGYNTMTVGLTNLVNPVIASMSAYIVGTATIADLRAALEKAQKDSKSFAMSFDDETKEFLENWLKAVDLLINPPKISGIINNAGNAVTVNPLTSTLLTAKNAVGADTYIGVAFPGSVGILLFNEYLATLNDGKHSLTVAFKDGAEAVIEFEVKNEIDNQNPNTGRGENPFTDVAESDWFYDDVAFVYANGLFSGTSDTTFSPETAMTRAMLVTVLFRLAAPAKGANTTNFADVPLGEYYSDAVAWAAENGIVEGYDGKFYPDEPISRQDLAVILLRYAELIGKGPVGAWAIRLDYADLDEVSDYAASAVMWTTLKGIISGKPDKILDPKAQASRAEVAAMLHRFADAVE